VLPTGFAFPLVSPVDHFLGVLPEGDDPAVLPPDDGSGAGAAAGESCSLISPPFLLSVYFF